MSTKNHWNSVYNTKKPEEVSWTEKYPKTSIDLIVSLNLEKSASIIDVGGGDSKLADCLLDLGYNDITVLDISAVAIERAQSRLGSRADKIKWVVSDILDFIPEKNYDVWHDRAAFHFLTTAESIKKYAEIASNIISRYLIIGAFSEKGPEKCSGLNIIQYREEKLYEIFKNRFYKVKCLTDDHETPFGTLQNFLFCCFVKNDNKY